MIGVSIYLSKGQADKQKEWLKIAKENGFSSIFTSLHIPEDDPDTYKELIQTLGKQALENEMELMVDISPKSLNHLGITYENVEVLLGFGIAPKEIARVSHKMKVALNASTITESLWEELLAENIRVENVEAWHNFYPRPETGLARSFLKKQNQYLHACGIKTLAFIPGDEDKRGPLYEGLPTLEKHRNMRPLEAFLELVQDCDVDKVLIGDISASLESVQEIASASRGIIPLRYESFINENEVLKVVEQVHTNRLDSARDVIRSVESREGNKVILQPMQAIARKKGSITIDNELYGRYAGEMQVVINDLPTDEKVNVVGMVVEEDVLLLPYIGAGKKFQLFLCD
ncbi:MupG family TIM beta-alpha barrel fold protein [Bacillus sp. FSL L8-0099]|uniref:DUF871 domain-containing protein n=1 Tax=unclassified Bacillus (in: firmicutes) TaxID=185979 RepID=UPI0030F4FCEB